jgi:hypothetical protein
MELSPAEHSDRSNEFYMWAMQIELKINYNEVASKIEHFRNSKRSSQHQF